MGGASAGAIEVFISHSSADAALAKDLAVLLREAIGLAKDDIRCTSVDGYRLPIGTDVAEQLRIEVHEAKAFVCLVTPNSLRSQYVMFELGARWGAGRTLFPLLGAGAGGEALKAPLSAMAALSCDVAAQVHQFVEDVSALLERSLAPAANYVSEVDDVVERSKSAASSVGPTSAQVEAQLQKGIYNFFESQSWFGPDPGDVMGGAKGIVARFAEEGATVVPSVEGEIEQRKQQDANWTYANRLHASLALVHALGLAPATADRNRVFLEMTLPAVAPKAPPPD